MKVTYIHKLILPLKRSLKANPTNLLLTLLTFALLTMGIFFSTSGGLSLTQSCSASEIPEKPQGIKHVVIIDIDGLRPDVFKEALELGWLPTFEEIIGGRGYADPQENAHAIIVQDARTGFPSLTLPGHASIFTGCFTNKHGIYGNSWFDRRKGKKGKSYHYLGSLKYDLANSHLRRKTIYDVAAKKGYDSIIGFNQYGGKSNLATWIQPTEYEKISLFITGETNDFDDAMMYSVLAELRRRMFNEEQSKWYANMFPKILTLYFVAVDHEGHKGGVVSQTSNLKEINDQLYQLIYGGTKTYPEPKEEDWNRESQGIEGREKPPDIYFPGLANIDAADGEGGKLFDAVVFVICADHGQSNVKEEEAHRICFDDIKYAIGKLDPNYDIGRILPENSKKRMREERLFSKKPKMMLELNDGMAHVYVQNKETDLWKDSPDLCNDIIPVARILARTQDTLGTYILRRNGVSMILIKDKADGRYKVFNDRTDCTSSLEELTKYFTDDESMRVNNLYHKDYSGDVVIMANYDNSAESEGFYLEDPYWSSNVITICPSPMKATHGNINSNDLKIPFIIAGRKVTSASISEAEQVDIAPTVADILGFWSTWKNSPNKPDGTSIFQK